MFLLLIIPVIYFYYGRAGELYIKYIMNFSLYIIFLSSINKERPSPFLIPPPHRFQSFARSTFLHPPFSQSSFSDPHFSGPSRQGYQ